MGSSQRDILNVGVVGLGRMGNRHASNFLRFVPRARLLCVCTPAPAELKWANQHLVPYGVQIYASFEEIIAVKDLEAVVIASSTALHVPQNLAALDRGLHVLCEKPISTSVAELSQIMTRLQDQSTTSSLLQESLRTGTRVNFDRDGKRILS